ncbi:MAG: STY0301 family protein [Rhizomicrobium sp.]
MMLFLGATALTLPPAVAGQDFTCPRAVITTQTTKDFPTNQHAGQDTTPRRLFDVSMAYADGISSREDYERNLPNGRVKYTWDLNAVVERRPWFVRCEYQQTNILLLIPVPETLKLCSTTQKDGPNRDVENIMHCK